MLTQPEKNVLAGTIQDAERLTSAEIVMVIAPASDAYQGIVLVYGFMLGSLIALALWLTGMVPDFPLLMAVQVTAISLLMFIPQANALCRRMVPERIARQRAARRAYEEYMTVMHYVPSSTPVALFYISLAERYVQIVQSPIVRDRISDGEWSHIVRTLTASIHDGLCAACVQAVESSAQLLAVHFPENVRQYGSAPNLIERAV